MDPREPCKDCPDRYLGCHDRCTKPEYLAARERQRKIREGRSRAALLDMYAIESVHRFKKDRRRRR